MLPNFLYFFIVAMIQFSSSTELEDRSLSHRIRIIGGGNCQYPFMVALFLREHPRWPFCGGSLITKYHVLTAAHCLVPNSKKKTEQPHKIFLLMGTSDISRRDKSTQTRIGKKFHIHPEFNKIVPWCNDIAVIRMNKPVSFTSTISPICLGTCHLTQPGIVTTVMGWGTTRDDEYSDLLQKVEVPIQYPKRCQINYPDMFLNTMICAGETKGGKDACQGDSGGPMVVQASSTVYRLIGIVSYGIGCAKPNIFGVYTNVCKYLSWIRKFAPKACL